MTIIQLVVLKKVNVPKKRVVNKGTALNKVAVNNQTMTIQLVHVVLNKVNIHKERVVNKGAALNKVAVNSQTMTVQLVHVVRSQKRVVNKGRNDILLIESKTIKHSHK